MADETLTKAGLHFDDLNKLRVLEPEVSSQSSDLNDECKDFLSSMELFLYLNRLFWRQLFSSIFRNLKTFKSFMLQNII